MRPPLFEYSDPKTVDEIIGLLSEHNDDARILAGGQSLLPMLNFRVAYPGHLIDFNNLTELDFIRETDSGSLEIGAMTRQSTVEKSNLVRDQLPLLHEGVGQNGRDKCLEALTQYIHTKSVWVNLD